MLLLNELLKINKIDECDYLNADLSNEFTILKTLI